MATRLLSELTGTPITLPVVTEWATYTLVVSGGTTNPSITYTTATGQWRRVGASMEIRGQFLGTWTAAGSGPLQINIPTGYTINTAGYSNSGIYTVFGEGTWFKNSTGITTLLAVATNGSSNLNIQFAKQGGQTLLTTDLSSSDQIGFSASLPIVEWTGSANVPVNGGTSSAGGLAASNVSANVALAVTNTAYECDLTTASFSITLPGGTTAAVIEVNDRLGNASSTKYLEVFPATGQAIAPYAVNDSIAYDYPGFNATLYRAAGDSTWYESRQTVTGGSASLLPIEVAANVTTAVDYLMYEFDLTSGPYTITLPGGTTTSAIGLMDSKGIASSTKFIRLTPAAGQSLDNLAVNDSFLLDFPYAYVVAYRAAGSTTWRLQKQSTSTVQGGQVPGNVSGSAIAYPNSGYVNRVTTTTNNVTNAVFFNVATLTLQPGSYTVSANIDLAPTVVNVILNRVVLGTSLQTAGTVGYNDVSMSYAAVGAGARIACFIPSVQYDVTVATQVYVVARVDGGTGQPVTATIYAQLR